jgi:single-strand selective monofunctional uracil DNA glycosylase
MIESSLAMHAAGDEPSHPRSVTAEISYAIDTGETPVNETFETGQVIRRRTGATEQRQVPIHDARAVSGELSLDRNGFQLVAQPTAVTDFFDAHQLSAVYYPEVERLVKQVSGAARVVVFDHTLRSGDEGEQSARKIREPVLWAHNDYTEWSGPQRVREILPYEAERLLAHRFAIIQVWRAIAGPILSNPLALVDARTVAAQDLIKAERRYPHRVGETYQLAYNRAHRWFYFPRMQRDEALIFKVYESRRDGPARFTPHCSFVDPSTPQGAPARQSTAVRGCGSGMSRRVLLDAAHRLSQALARLEFPPPVAHVYDPHRYAWAPYEAYVTRYGSGHKRVMLLGMNPGPFGMMQTGVPFGEVAAVRDWMGIFAAVHRPEHEHPKRPIEGFDCRRSEVSGRRLWGWAARRFGTAEAFFRDWFVLNYCPLVFLELSGRNLTPDKLPAKLLAEIYAACDRHLVTALSELRPHWAIGAGAFAEKRIRAALQGGGLDSALARQMQIGQILHPSPASPAANRGWSEAAERQLAALGVPGFAA